MQRELERIPRHPQSHSGAWKPWVLPKAQAFSTGVSSGMPQVVAGRRLTNGMREDIVM